MVRMVNEEFGRRSDYLTPELQKFLIEVFRPMYGDRAPMIIDDIASAIAARLRAIDAVHL